MEYELTDERNAYLQARGYVVLSACPGSGKTTSIVRKLKDIAKYCETQYGSHTGFACLSFTNKACNEIKTKYHDMHGDWLHFPNVVSTIDSFIMQNVVIPFWYLYPNCTKRPVIVNETDLLKKMFEVKYTDSHDGKIKKTLPTSLRQYRDIAHHKILPEKVSLVDYLKYKKAKDEEGKEIYKYIKAVMNFRISKGIITSDDALYMACCILYQHKIIANILSRRYPYIIVDEAQDNSYHQHVFFRLLMLNGLKNLEMVGDPCQSIYRFRRAKPELFVKLMTNRDWTTLHFSECRRSNQRIIDLYNKLKPTNTPDTRSLGVDNLGIPIHIYKYDEGNITMIMQHFNDVCNNNKLRERAIIARGDAFCRKIAGVKETDLNYWKSRIPYLIIDAQLLKSKGNYDKAFANLRKVICNILYNEEQYEEKRAFLSNIENDLDWNKKILKFLSQIPSLSLSFSEWTSSISELLKDYWNVDHDIDLQPYKRITGHNMHELSAEPVEKYYSSVEHRSQYRNVANTIHSLKGASVDAVLLFLSGDSRGNNISIHDFPTTRINTFNEMGEKQSLIYVACSRAKQFLALAVPSTTNDTDIDRVFHGLDYTIKNIGVQQELQF